MNAVNNSKSPLVFTFNGKVHNLSARTHLMAILNVTPDSFSDGGRYFETTAAVERGLELAEAGADFLDIGGESTRPGSDPVPEEEEIRRVVPVIQRLSSSLGIPISIDTYKSGVARAALSAGACIVNDISGLTFDTAMVDVVSAYEASVIIMHVLGSPKTMQLKPVYDDVVQEVYSFLEKQASRARDRGIRQIILDPGLGFGKELHHNLELMKHLGTFSRLGYPVLAGPSRKSFIGKLLDLPADQRLEGTAAAVTACILRGAHIVRVHDVKEMKRVAVIADALKVSGEGL